MTSENIKAGWRHTGNWPISRRKALAHPEIQPDPGTPEPPKPDVIDRVATTPKSGRDVRDMGKNKTPRARRQFALIAKGYDTKDMELAIKDAKIASLEEELARLKRTKKRKAIPNPNRRFMEMAEILHQNDGISNAGAAQEVVEEVEETSDEESENSLDEEISPPPKYTRLGRQVKRPHRYDN